MTTTRRPQRQASRGDRRRSAPRARLRPDQEASATKTAITRHQELEHVAVHIGRDDDPYVVIEQHTTGMTPFLIGAGARRRRGAAVRAAVGRGDAPRHPRPRDARSARRREGRVRRDRHRRRHVRGRAPTGRRADRLGARSDRSQTRPGEPRDARRARRGAGSARRARAAHRQTKAAYNAGAAVPGRRRSAMASAATDSIRAARDVCRPRAERPSANRQPWLDAARLREARVGQQRRRQRAVPRRRHRVQHHPRRAAVHPAARDRRRRICSRSSYRGAINSDAGRSRCSSTGSCPRTAEVNSPYHKLINDLLRTRRTLTIYSAVGFIWFSTRLFGSLRTVLASVFDIESERGIIAGKIFDVKITIVSTAALRGQRHRHDVHRRSRRAGTGDASGLRNDVIGSVQYCGRPHARLRLPRADVLRAVQVSAHPPRAREGGVGRARRSPASAFEAGADGVLVLHDRPSIQRRYIRAR